MVKILVLGASGMLGNAVFRLLSDAPGFQVTGTLRSPRAIASFDEKLQPNFVTGVDVEDNEGLAKLFDQVKPDVVVNCIGLVKQLAEADDPLEAIPINSLLPHRLARHCERIGGRLIHVSTDCVFAGTRGNYVESDFPDANDLYGRSKYLGELHNVKHAITLRTSIIGRELDSAHGLVDWFLSQEKGIKGYTRAIFSGLPTVELAEVIRDYVIPHPELFGLYHVSAKAISKYDLLQIVAAEYGRDITISPDDRLILDRSLDSARFSAATGYVADAWPELIQKMKAFA